MGFILIINMFQYFKFYLNRSNFSTSLDFDTLTLETLEFALNKVAPILELLIVLSNVTLT